VVMFNGCVRSYTLGLRGGGWENYTLALGIERKYSPVKRGLLLLQHDNPDLDVIRYHGCRDSS